MATVEDLGKKVKAKYPEYKDISDIELGRKVKAKYPEYSSFTDVPDSPSQTPTPTGPTGVERTGRILGSIFGGEKIGEAMGAAGVRKDVRQGTVPGVVEADYSKLSPEAIERLKTKGVPVTAEAQREETAGTVKGPTAGQIVGDVAHIASNFIGAGAAGKVGSLAVKGTVKRAAMTGLKEGAITGAVGGFGGGMKQENANVGSVVGSTIGGAAAGGVLGAGIGAAGSKIAQSAARRTKVLPNLRKEVLTKDALEITKPVLNKSERTAAIASGRATREGIFRNITVKPSKQDKEIAESVASVVKRSKHPEQNIEAINKKVSSLNNEIKRSIRQNDSIFNQNQLRSRLEKAKEKSQVIFAGDTTLENRYNAIVEEMMRNIDKNNLSGLLDARQKFDSVVKQKFPRTFDGNPSDAVVKNAILDVRREVNEFIADTLPPGNKYKEILRKEHLMLNARENIAENLQSLLESNAINRALKTPLGRATKEALPYVIGGGLLAKGATTMGK